MSVNIRNIIGLIELFESNDYEEMNPVESMFISKTGTLYDAVDGELVVRTSDTAMKIFGVTGKTVLKSIDESMVRIPVTINGKNYNVVGLIDQDIVGKVLDDRLE